MTATPGGWPGRPTRAVIFDLDDTLIDTHTSFIAALDAVAERWLPDRTGTELVGVWRADADGHYRAYTRGELSYHEQRHARADALVRHFGGGGIDATAYGDFREVFDGAWQAAWAAFPDAVACLERLEAAGVGIGIVTNADVALQRSKLHQVGLDALAETLVGIDTLGVGKPDARVFLRACELARVQPEAALYIGDELDVDALAARRAGLEGVWLDRPGLGHPDGQRVEAARLGVTRLESLDELEVPLGAAGG